MYNVWMIDSNKDNPTWELVFSDPNYHEAFQHLKELIEIPERCLALQMPGALRPGAGA